MAETKKKKSFFGNFNDIPEPKGDDYTNIDLDLEAIDYKYEKGKEFDASEMLSGKLDEYMSKAAGVEFKEEEPAIERKPKPRPRPKERLELPDDPDKGWGGEDDYDDYIEVGDNAGPRADYDDYGCLLYTSPSPRDATLSRMPSSA